MTTISIPNDWRQHSSTNASFADAARRKLPKRAKDRDKAISRDWRKHRIAMDTSFAEDEELQERRRELVFQLDHYKRDVVERFGEIGPEERQRLADFDAQLADIDNQRAELAAERAALPAPFDPSTRDAWLAANAARRFKPYNANVTLEKGQSAVSALALCRANMNEAHNKISQIASAQITAEEGIKNAVAEIERIAECGEPYMGRCRLTDESPSGRTRVGTIRWPLYYDPAGKEHGDAFALTVWALKDVLIAKAKADLTDMEEGAIPLADRPAMIADLRAELRALEYREGALILMAEAETGRPVAIRSDMDVGALLQVEIDTTPVPKPVPEPDESERPITEAERKAMLKRLKLRSPSRLAAEPDPDFG